MSDDAAAAQRLVQAIRVGNIGIFDHDHLTDVIYWSRELRDMYGWSDNEPVTLPKIIAQAHPEDLASVIEAVRHAHDPSGDGSFDIEHRILNRRGETRWVLMRSQTYFEPQAGELKPRRTIGAVQDVSERRASEERLRKMEAQLIHAQKMESLGRLAGGVAHDFNNLLTVISGNIDLSRALLADTDPSRTYLGDAADAARSAATLTRQLLAFSRKEAIAPKAHDLNEIIRRMQKMVVRLLGEDIELQTSCAASLPSILFDLGQAEQIILNLAVNARDAMPDGGKLSIGTSTVTRREVNEEQTYVLLQVSDNGLGMTEEVRARLFEPFFTTKQVGKGTGLGLAMVYGAVQQNGGQIEVESELGRGTTFKIYLRSTTALPAAPAPRPPARVEKPRDAAILLVEDDAKVRSLATVALHRLGYRVHAFADGEQALANLATLEPVPELLMTDVIMPGMNGRVLAELVTARLPEIRVLFVSGYPYDVIAEHGILQDGIDFLPKPFSAEQLALHVGRLLEACA